jgi:DNA-binding PadR family transcriptional regulator
VDAQRRVYRLRPEGLREVDAWIEPYRQLWTDRLDRLDRHLQHMKEMEGSEID